MVQTMPSSAAIASSSSVCGLRRSLPQIEEIEKEECIRGFFEEGLEEGWIEVASVGWGDRELEKAGGDSMQVRMVFRLARTRGRSLPVAERVHTCD